MLSSSLRCMQILKVLQHESGAEKYLTVATTGSAWRIYSTIDERLGWIESSSAGSSCPASPAAAISKRLGRKNWQYWDGSLWGSAWHEGGVTVTCETPGLCLWFAICTVCFEKCMLCMQNLRTIYIQRKGVEVDTFHIFKPKLICFFFLSSDRNSCSFYLLVLVQQAPTF